MKTIVIILSTLVCLTSFRKNCMTVINVNQQQDMFAGTWTYQNGNEVFIVILWRVTDGYKGHYKKIKVDANGNQTVEVYNSDKPIGNTTAHFPYVMSSGDISQNYLIGGTFRDNTVTNPSNGGGFVEGGFRMQVLNPSCFDPLGNNSCALQAHWTVKKDQGLSDPKEPDFSVPKDIILTKK
jgi:hypothetical protein